MISIGDTVTVGELHVIQRWPKFTDPWTLHRSRTAGLAVVRGTLWPGGFNGGGRAPFVPLLFPATSCATPAHGKVLGACGAPQSPPLEGLQTLHF